MESLLNIYTNKHNIIKSLLNSLMNFMLRITFLYDVIVETAGFAPQTADKCLCSKENY